MLIQIDNVAGMRVKSAGHGNYANMHIFYFCLLPILGDK